MHAYFQNKRLILLLAVLALGALTVLAISLNEVPFREGQHYGQQATTTVEFFPGDIGQVWVEVPIWKQILVWGLIGLMVILAGLSAILSPLLLAALLGRFLPANELDVSYVSIIQALIVTQILPLAIGVGFHEGAP